MLVHQTLAVQFLGYGDLPLPTERERSEDASDDLDEESVIPAVGIVLFSAALYGSVCPAPVYPLNLTPYVAHIWLMAGIIVVALLRNRRPATMRRIGSIVGEEGDLPPERVPWWLNR